MIRAQWTQYTQIFFSGRCPLRTEFSQSLHLRTALFRISDKCAGSLDIKTRYATMILVRSGKPMGQSVDFRFFCASIQTVSSWGVWVAYKWNRMGCLISGSNYNSVVKIQRRDLKMLSASGYEEFSRRRIRNSFGRQNSIRIKLWKETGLI